MERVHGPPGLAEYRAGARVCGRFVITRRIRSDGFFTVYAAHMADARERLATVWQFHRAFGGSVAAFQREMLRVRNALEHRALARVLAFGIEPNGPVVVTARPFDTTLTEVLARAEPLRPNEVGFFVSEIASGLDLLHAQTPPVLHSMISPDCVIVAARSGPVWLDGAGILGALREAGWLDDPEVLPTAASYLSPGVLLDSVDRHADLFNLASLTFECLTGRRAFDGDDGAQVRGAIVKGTPTAPGGGMVSPTVRAALDRAWSPRRAEAFESATDFALSLSRELVSVHEVRTGKSTLQQLAPVGPPGALPVFRPQSPAPQTPTRPSIAAVPPAALPSQLPPPPSVRAAPYDPQTDREVDQAFDDLFKARNTASFGVVLPPADRTGPNRAVAAAVVSVGSDPPRKPSLPSTMVGRGVEPEPALSSDAPGAVSDGDGTQPMYAHVEELLSALAAIDPTRPTTPAGPPDGVSTPLPLIEPEEPGRLTPVPSVKPLPAPVPAQADVTARYSPLPALAALNLAAIPQPVAVPDTDRPVSSSSVPTTPPLVGASAVPSTAPVVPVPPVPAAPPVVVSAPSAPAAPSAASSGASAVSPRPVARTELILALRGSPRRSRRRVGKRASAPAQPAAVAAIVRPVESLVPHVTPAPQPPAALPPSALVSRAALMLSATLFLVGVVHTAGGVYKARVERETEALREAHAVAVTTPPPATPPIATPPPAPTPSAVAEPPPPAPTPEPQAPTLNEPPPTAPTPPVRARRPPVPTPDVITETEIRVGRAVTPCVRGVSAGRHLRFDVRYTPSGAVTAVRVLGLFANPPFMQCIITAAAHERIAPFSNPTWLHTYTYTTGAIPLTPVRPNVP